MTEKARRKRLNKRLMFPVGTIVRISLDKNSDGIKQKGYTHRWTTTLYKVSEVLHGRDVYAYKLVDADTNEQITSIFYNENLSGAK
jgi:hypothetical protein